MQKRVMRRVVLVAEADRRGQVFKVGLFKRIREADWKYKASKLICRIGRVARVVVAVDPRTGRQKFASAHDLRRSFGDRWSRRVLPQQLQELMRHESISTTLRFYVGRNAERTWEVMQEACDKVRSAETRFSPSIVACAELRSVGADI